MNHFLKPFLLFIVITLLTSCATEPKPDFVFSCQENNDIFKAAEAIYGELPRYNSALEAVNAAKNNAGVLIFANTYPEKTEIDAKLLDIAKSKNLKLYIEYPDVLPELEIGDAKKVTIERGVITDASMNEELPLMKVLYLHESAYLPVAVESPLMVIANVAGFNKAVYGLDSTDAYPLLFEYEKGNVLVATAKLSQCITARYAPLNDWKMVWNYVFNYLQSEKHNKALDWMPSVIASYSKEAILKEGAETEAVKKGTEWYFNSNMFIDESWLNVCDENGRKAITDMPDLSWKCGDGSLGVLEGFASSIHEDGTQDVRWWRRADCTMETAMTLALSGQLLKNNKYLDVAEKLTDWFAFKSMMTQGERADKTHPAYGLFGWHEEEKYWGDMDGFGVYYNDDQPRVVIGLATTAGLLKTDKWNNLIIKNMVANLRITSPQGFRERRLDEKPLEENGWQYYLKRDYTHLSPHFQANLWAANLWMYHKTGYHLFLDRTKSGISAMMEAYPDKWYWTNGLQQERAKMILALAWLVRVEDNEQHREWLKFMAKEIIKDQVECGAVREEIGENEGKYGPPKSNNEYGKKEAPLIHVNGDPLTDLLYTTNFLFIGLHEAYAVTNDEYYKNASDKLAEFFCRIQIESSTHPELHGGWFRAFDYEQWDYTGSNSDLDWGVWNIETGWSQSAVVSVLSMREMKKSLWEIMDNVEIDAVNFDKIRKEMLPDELVK